MSELPRLPVPLEHHVLKWACGLSPRTSRALFGKPPKVDGQTLSTETHALLTLARWSGSNGFFAGKSVEEARAQSRYEARVSSAAAADPDGRGARRRRPRAGRTAPLRASTSPRSGAPGSGPAARLLPRRRLGDRRPRHPRRGVPAPRRGVRAAGSSRSATGWLPSTRSRPRSMTPSPRSSGRSRTPSRSAPTRSGSASAATAPAATWRRSSATWRATAAARCPRCSC